MIITATKTYDQHWAGIKYHSFKEQVVRDWDKYWRYPIKQEYNPKLCFGHDPEYLEIQHQVARESWNIACEINQSKSDKKDTPDTLFQRALELLKKKDSKNIQEITKTIIQLYVDEERPLNKSTIQGYAITAAVKLGTLSVDQLADQWAAV